MFSSNPVFALFNSTARAVFGPAVEYLKNAPAAAINNTTEADAKAKPYAVYGGVAVIRLSGGMARGVHPLIAELFGLTDTGRATRDIRLAARDSEVDAIILQVNSPGGSVDGLMELSERIEAAAEVKPVVAVVDGLAASAAYWAISGASSIFARDGDLIGSIGVRTVMYDVSGMFEKQGIETVATDTGEFKSVGVEGKPITDEHKADLQRVVDGYFAQFKKVVQRGRAMDDKQFEAVSDGRVFFADEAKRLGLIDDFGTFETVLNSLQRMAAAKRRLDSL